MAEYEDKFKGLDEELAKDLQSYEILYFREDKPVPFCGLNIYPVKVRDYEVFSNCLSVVTLDKNNDLNAFKMTQLDYLISKTMKEGEEGAEWSFKIQKLFELIFHIKNGLKCTKCGKVIDFSSEQFTNYVEKIKVLAEKQEKGVPIKEEEYPSLICEECGNGDWIEMIKIKQDEQTKKNYLLVDGQKITNKDFLRLRQIVLFQNFPDYVNDSWVDPDLKRDHEEKIKLEQKKTYNLHATTEKKIVCLSIATNYKCEEIYDMSFRRFTLALMSVDDLINYKILRTAVSSGFTSLPEGETIEHWIYKPVKDIYGDSYKSLDKAEAEVQRINT